MKIITLCYFCIICTAFECAATSASKHTTKKSKCLNPPRTARRVESFINECQEEVKNKLVNEAFQMIKQEVSKDKRPFDEEPERVLEIFEAPHSPASAAGYAGEPTNAHNEYLENDVDDAPRRTARLMHRIRRVSDPTTVIYHPTLVPSEDKRIAGCLLHCVYAKNNAIDQLGWPTLDGLVHFYSEGVNEHGFFMATLRSVNLCLRAVTVKYRVNRRKLPESGESCDLAFDVFDCISDQITGYCLDQFK